MFDLIIIGAGPAGLTASIYASCFKLNHFIIGKEMGGQMGIAPDIVNYPGFEQISGKELTERMISQVKKRGINIEINAISKIEKINDGFSLFTNDGKTYETKSIIIATGTERRKLNIPGEVEYTNLGVLYCATCAESEYLNKTIAIVGGANSAAQAVIKLHHDAIKTYLIYRGSELRCDPMLLEQIKNNPKVEIIYNCQPEEIIGDGQKVTGMKLKLNSPPNVSNIPGLPNHLSVEKIFIEIGGVPGTALLIPLGVEMDEGGYIKVNEELSTNIPGVFAAGDIVNSKLSIEQVATAVGLGARAAVSTFSYLKGQKAPNLWGQSQITR